MSELGIIANARAMVSGVVQGLRDAERQLSDTATAVEMIAESHDRVYQEDIGKAKAAYKRAKQLLESLLDPEQLELYQKDKCFVAVGGETGEHYLILTRKTQGNVINLSNGIFYCLIPADRWVPAGDQFVAQLLMIQCEEREFKRQANKLARLPRNHIAKRLVGYLTNPSLDPRDLVNAAPEAEPDENDRDFVFTNPFEAAMPNFADIQFSAITQTDQPCQPWHPGSTCHCSACEAAREQYALERGRAMERLLERELIGIITSQYSPAEAVRYAEDELRQLRTRASPVMLPVSEPRSRLWSGRSGGGFPSLDPVLSAPVNITIADSP